MSFLFNVLGSGDGPPAAENGADTVEKFVSRLQSSTLLEDRREAMRGLKALSKQFKLEVGTQGMDALISAVDKDRGDTEVVANGLEALLQVTAADVKEGENPSDSDLGVQFTEIFVKKQDNVSVLLNLLEEYDFPVRWPTVKLLTALLTNKPTRVQECVLESPGSVPRLMDLLSDSREIIRNDGLLLLTRLASRNTQIQRMLAFSGGMEQLLDIITEEGHSDGGIVVEDCILLLLNLIRSNSSNQNYFREASLVPRLAPFFDFSSDAGEWSAQKVRNVTLLLRLIRAFAAPVQSQAQSTTASQRAFAQCGVLTTLSNLMFATNLDRSVSIEMMSTVAELVRGDAQNQAIFIQVTIASRPALLYIILSLVEDKRAVELRLASLYCLQCVLLQNRDMQQQVVATLMPTDSQASQPSQVTAGQLLCRGLFSGDEVTMWCSAAALVACMETQAIKEELLRVQLAVGEGTHVALLHQAGLLAARKDLKFRGRVGLLILLSHWIHDCPAAVGKLLTSPPCVQFLTTAIEEQTDSQEQTIIRGLAALLVGLCLLAKGVKVTGEYTQESLLEIAQKRILAERFAEALSGITQSELYMRAAQSYYPPGEVVFDFQYTQLVRRTSDTVLQMVRGELPIPSDPPSPSSSDRLSPDVQATSTHIMEHDAVVTSYKELIRDQDSQLIQMREEASVVSEQRNKEREERTRLADDLATSKQQKLDIDSQLHNVRQQCAQLEDEKSALAHRLAAMEDERQRDREERAKLAQRLESVESRQHDVADGRMVNGGGDQSPGRLQQDVDSLGQLLQTSERELQKQQHLLLAREEEVTVLSGRLQMAEQEMDGVRQEMLCMREQTQDIDGDDLQMKCKRYEAQLQELSHRHKKLTEDNEDLTQGHEDLLVLLADQDTRIASLRERLVKHGDVVTDSEEDDDESEDSESAGDEDDH